MKISKLLNEIPEPLRPIFKPLAVALGVFVTITTIEFFLLAIAEVKDGNYWSFSVRMLGLLGTFIAGRLVWKGLGSMKEKLAPPTMAPDLKLVDLPGVVDMNGNPMMAFAPADVPVVVSDADDSDVHTRPHACPCGSPFIATSFGLCVRCWEHRVEDRLAAIEARQGVAASVDGEPAAVAPQSVQESRA